MTKDLYPKYIKKSLRPIKNVHKRHQWLFHRKDKWPIKYNNEKNLYHFRKVYQIALNFFCSLLYLKHP